MPRIETVYRDLEELKPGGVIVLDRDETTTIEGLDRPRDFSGRWLVQPEGGERTYFDEGDRIPIAATPPSR